MKRKIDRLNKLYQPVIEKIDSISKILESKQVKYNFGFYNNHEIKVKGQFIKEIYPIPVISFRLNNVETDIGIDLTTSSDYIGFVELTLNKREILLFDFKKLDDCNFEIYGFDNCLEDFYFGDLNKTQELISKSKEKKFHIGILASNVEHIKQLISKF